MTRPLHCLVATCTLLAAVGASAQYKIIGPDGRVSYTDRPPAAADGKVAPLATRPTAEADVALPYELRQVVSRYPVVLYAAANCPPCDSARRWLQERGIPYGERSIASSEDSQALTTSLGSADLPALTIGAQASRGFAADEWGSLLDAAGYPRSSRLPRNYRYAAAVPLAPRAQGGAPATPVAAPPASDDAAPADAPASTDNPTGIRF